MSEALSSVTSMAPLPDCIRSAGLTRVTIIKNHGTDDEERVEVEAQLLDSKEGRTSRSKIPWTRETTWRCLIIEEAPRSRSRQRSCSIYMPVNMRGGFGGSNGMTEVRWGEAEPVRRAPVRRLDLQRLHPQVISAASALFADRQYDSAVTEDRRSRSRSECAT